MKQQPIADTGLIVGLLNPLKYHPQADYADACVVALHEALGGRVYSTDRRDFLVYCTRAGLMVDAVLPEPV